MTTTHTKLECKTQHFLKIFMVDNAHKKYPSQQQNHPIWKQAKEAWKYLAKIK
jgi:hypothetical protein